MDTVRDIVVFCGRPIYFAYQEIRSEATICDGILHIPSNTFKGLAKGLDKSNLTGKVTWVLSATLASFLGLAVLSLICNSRKTSTVRPPATSQPTDEERNETTRARITERMQKPVLTLDELEQLKTQWQEAGGCQEDDDEIMKKFALCENLLALMDDPHQIDSLAQAIESARESFAPAAEGEADVFQSALDAHEAHVQARQAAEEELGNANKGLDIARIQNAIAAFTSFEGINDEHSLVNTGWVTVGKLSTPQKTKPPAATQKDGGTKRQLFPETPIGDGE